MSTYAARRAGIHDDGTTIFATEQDTRNESEVATALQREWSCELHRFGALAPLDWFATRHGRLTAVLELKSRTHAADRYPTVFLNVRKWLALNLATVGLGVPAVFVVRFTDAVRWTLVGSDPQWSARIAGCGQIVKSRSDIEPVFEVPVAEMKQIGEAP